jgi:hypothetical protein
MSKSETMTPATSVVETASSSTRAAMAVSNITTTSVKIAKQRGKSSSNSNPLTESMTLDNFFGKPVGAAVLFLNDFHFGGRLNDLNRCARLVPDDVKGMASMLSPDNSAESAGYAIDTLVSWADDAQKNS